MKEKNFLQKIFAGAEQLELKKGELLLRNGEISSKSYYVEEGCLRSFTIDKKGKEHVIMFAPAGWIVGDLEGMLSNVPSVLNIDVLENSRVYCISDLGKAAEHNTDIESLREG